MAVDGTSLRRHGRASRRSQAMTDIVLTLAVGALVMCAVVFMDPLITGGMILVASATYLMRSWIFNWTSAMVVLAAVILFVPIRRYALPVDVGPKLEPY